MDKEEKDVAMHDKYNDNILSIMGTKMAMRNKMIIEFIILKSELMKD
jgi:hypothetical protein